MKIQLVIGLGNPGSAYQGSLHNVGQDFLRSFALDHHAHFHLEKKFKGEIAELTLAERKLFCLLPTTFMNLSGESASPVVQFYKIPPEHLLVIHDDIDLPLGALRVKKGGGHGGHNGLRSLFAHLGSQDFLRLRIGVGRPAHSAEVTAHVLNQPQPETKAVLQESFKKLAKALPDLIAEKFSAVQQILHTEG